MVRSFSLPDFLLLSKYSVIVITDLSQPSRVSISSSPLHITESAVFQRALSVTGTAVQWWQGSFSSLIVWKMSYIQLNFCSCAELLLRYPIPQNSPLFPPNYSFNPQEIKFCAHIFLHPFCNWESLQSEFLSRGKYDKMWGSMGTSQNKAWICECQSNMFI